MMKGEPAERLHSLCEQAQTEQHPVKFMEIIEEINRLLEQEEQRLRNLERKDE